MPTTDTFTYTLRARCEVADALALLSDFSRHTELHPFIIRVREVPPAGGAVRSFVINDRFPLGPFHFTTTDAADVLRLTDSAVVTVARQKPGTTLRNETRIHPLPDGGIRVDVTITLTAPTLLFGYAFKQAQAAHHALAERLPEVLEKASGGTPHGVPPDGAGPQ